jgi:hypothetical protein
MAAKKKSKSTRGGHPSPAMIRDLTKVMKKHNFVGRTLMWKPMAEAHMMESMGQGGCPDGQSPHTISYQLPTGEWVTKTVCS